MVERDRAVEMIIVNAAVELGETFVESVRKIVTAGIFSLPGLNPDNRDFLHIVASVQFERIFFPETAMFFTVSEMAFDAFDALLDKAEAYYADTDDDAAMAREYALLSALKDVLCAYDLVMKSLNDMQRSPAIRLPFTIENNSRFMRNALHAYDASLRMINGVYMGKRYAPLSELIDEPSYLALSELYEEKILPARASFETYRERLIPFIDLPSPDCVKEEIARTIERYVAGRTADAARFEGAQLPYRYGESLSNEEARVAQDYLFVLYTLVNQNPETTFKDALFPEPYYCIEGNVLRRMRAASAPAFDVIRSYRAGMKDAIYDSFFRSLKSYIEFSIHLTTENEELLMHTNVLGAITLFRSIDVERLWGSLRAYAFMLNARVDFSVVRAYIDYYLKTHAFLNAHKRGEA